MKYQALIFDLDGTIIDTSNIWKHATRKIIESYGTLLTDELSEKLEKELCGIGLHDSCSIIKKRFKINNSVKNLIKEKENLACKLYQGNLQFVQGFESFYKKVSDYKLKTGVATSSAQNTLNNAKDQLKLERFFGEHIYGISCVDNIAKPEPAIFLYTAQKLGIKPESCFVIEDSPVGVSAAKNAGMFCIGINTAGIPEKIAHADMVVDSFDQINLEKLIG